MLTPIQTIDVLKYWNLWGGIDLAKGTVKAFVLIAKCLINKQEL